MHDLIQHGLSKNQKDTSLRLGFQLSGYEFCHVLPPFLGTGGPRYLTPDSKCNYECPAGYWERGTEEVGGTCELLDSTEVTGPRALFSDTLFEYVSVL